VGKVYFLDTGYIVALLNTSDQWHELAKEWRDRVIRERIQLVTTDYVLVEIADGLAALRFRRQAKEVIRALRGSKDVDVISASTELFEAGLALYSSREDKEWGLTDCISIVVMGRRGITEVLSVDRDFEQAGYKVLLRSDNHLRT
jgi:predicted nucleic acid-binding protein